MGIAVIMLDEVNKYYNIFSISKHQIHTREATITSLKNNGGGEIAPSCQNNQNECGFQHNKAFAWSLFCSSDVLSCCRCSEEPMF